MKLVRSILDGNSDVSPEDIRHLTGLVQDHYRQSPNVLDLPSEKVIFIGDLHGELQCAQNVQRYVEKYEKHHFVFLGDYADRGPQQIETFNLVMALTIANPKRVSMLRGNHESDSIATKYGFYSVVTKAFSFDVFKQYSHVFEVLPVAVYKKGTLFACHGGVPEGISSIEEIQGKNRKHPDFPDDTLFQLVWNDPEDRDYTFRSNSRSQRARRYGRIGFLDFMESIEAQIMFRAHQVFPDGFKKFFDEKLVSVFSATYGPRVHPKIVRFCQGLSIEFLELHP
jgi:hypothetical protein